MLEKVRAMAMIIQTRELLKLHLSRFVLAVVVVVQMQPREVDKRQVKSAAQYILR